MKKENLKINVLNSTEDEKNIFEEFNKLETKTAACISLVKSTKTSQKEKNKKHNRYSDIGKTHKIKPSLISFVNFLVPYDDNLIALSEKLGNIHSNQDKKILISLTLKDNPPSPMSMPLISNLRTSSRSSSPPSLQSQHHLRTSGN